MSYITTYIHIYTHTHTRTYIHTHTYTHVYLHIYIQSMDPLVCHADSRMWNKSQIQKYASLQCKILQIFYKNNIINHHVVR
jgi:hypothetical protein